MTLELAGLPILCRPKEGAVESTFNEQSQTLSPSPSLSQPSLLAPQAA